MYDLGYASIGCAPCTRVRFDGEPERAGRWAGFSKWECGIHQRETAQQPEVAGQATTIDLREDEARVDLADGR
jgi:3'-phosphoadenosine 5'-phosphosulfate sulfotransferase (PAPS reductase)/FAD synthetase